MTPARFLKSTSRRSFILYPVVLLGIEWLLQGDELSIHPLGLALMAWGYLQYRLGGRYRSRLGGGGPGLGKPPVRLVTTGIYRYTRNPMYLGHLIFYAGLAVALRSWVAVALLLVHIPWFHRRVLRDEANLARLFGAEFDEYRSGVRRWIPYLV